MSSLLPVIGVLFAVAITPGPNNIIVMQAGARGMRRVAAAVLGIAIGATLLLTLVWFGFEIAMRTVPAFTIVLHLLGGAYLAWLGLMLFVRHEQSSADRATPATTPGIPAFQLLNPKGWMLVAAGIAAMPQERSFILLLLLLVAVTGACSIVGALAGTSATPLFAHQTARRFIDRILGAVLILSALAIGTDGLRHILGMAEAKTGDLQGWRGFLQRLKDRGLKGGRRILSEACRGLTEAAAELFPKADWRRCVVHFYRNVFSHGPNGNVPEVARRLKASPAPEDRSAAEHQAREIVARLKAMKLKSAAELVEQKVAGMLTDSASPSTPWRQIRTNSPLERIIREIRRRTRVVGACPDGHSALMWVAARRRHIAATRWGKRRNLVMETLLNPAKQEVAA